MYLNLNLPLALLSFAVLEKLESIAAFGHLHFYFLFL